MDKLMYSNVLCGKVFIDFCTNKVCTYSLDITHQYCETVSNW